MRRIELFDLRAVRAINTTPRHICDSHRGTCRSRGRLEREFWVAKWVVPQETPIGIVRFTVTASDKYGRTGEFTPFEVQASQLTIIE